MAKKPSGSSTRPPIAALKDVRLADGAVQMFDGVDLALEPRVRACLVGKNGAGKSTLLRILAGLVEPDAGDRFMQPGMKVAMVLQEPKITGKTVSEYAASGGAPDYMGDSALLAFGLDPEKSTEGLSGGEIRRVALAKAFAEEPDLILLDEPTNHLDIFAIQELEEQIRSSSAACLIISHDRAFLERTTQRCFWLAHRKVRALDQGFGAFEAWAAKIEEEEAEQMKRLAKTIERETATFYSSITARRTRNEGRARSLDALRQEQAAKMKDVGRTMEMNIDSGSTSGKRVAEVKHVSKAWGDKIVVRDFSTRIQRGDRLAVVGPNGAGKTTMVRVLLGEITPDEGEVKLGTQLEIAYVDQSRAELNAETTLWDVLADSGDQIMVRGRPMHVAAYAKSFLFQDKQLRQPVKSLSGGERNRLLLAKSLARPANLMVLDEPTNDLDMDTLDLLEELLSDYDGTLILVSHDRDFVDRLATSTIALDGNGRAVETPGGWTDFMRQNPGFFGQGALPPLTREPKAAVAVSASAAPAAAKPAEPAAPVKKLVKLTFKDQRRLEELDLLLSRLPVEISENDAKLEDPGFYARDPKGFDSVTKAGDKMRKDFNAAEEEWLGLEAKREGA